MPRKKRLGHQKGRSLPLTIALIEPLNEDVDNDSHENRSLNRRVVIRVKYEGTETTNPDSVRLLMDGAGLGLQDK